MSTSTSKAGKSVKNVKVPIAENIDVLPMKNNHAQAPEPNLDAEKAKIWKSQVLIPYTVAGENYAFLGPYPDLSVDST